MEPCLTYVYKSKLETSAVVLSSLKNGKTPASQKTYVRKRSCQTIQFTLELNRWRNQVLILQGSEPHTMT